MRTVGRREAHTSSHLNPHLQTSAYRRALADSTYSKASRLHLQLQYQRLRINWLIKIKHESLFSFFPLNPSILYRNSLFNLWVFTCWFLIPSRLCSRLPVCAGKVFPRSIPSTPNGITRNYRCQSFHHPPILPVLLLQEIPQYPQGKSFLKSRCWCKNLITFYQNIPSFYFEVEQGFLFYFMTANTKPVATFLTSSIDSIRLLFLINSTSGDTGFYSSPFLLNGLTIYPDKIPFLQLTGSPLRLLVLLFPRGLLGAGQLLMHTIDSVAFLGRNNTRS